MIVKSDFQKQVDKMDNDMKRWKNTIISILPNTLKIRQNGYRFYWVTLNKEITLEQTKRLLENKIEVVTKIPMNKKLVYMVKCEYPKEMDELE